MYHSSVKTLTLSLVYYTFFPLYCFRFQSQPEMTSLSLGPLCRIQPYLERFVSPVQLWCAPSCNESVLSVWLDDFGGQKTVR